MTFYDALILYEDFNQFTLNFYIFERSSEDTCHPAILASIISNIRKPTTPRINVIEI